MSKKYFSNLLRGVFLITAPAIVILFFAGQSAAQYRAGIGCAASQIDQMSANTTIEQFECICFNKCTKEKNNVRPENLQYRIFEGRDIDGDDLAMDKNSSLERCTAACKNESKCKAFSYNKWTRWCFLKSTIPSEIRIEPNSIVAVISSASPRLSSAPVVMQKYHNARFLDSFYRRLVNVSYDRCQSECEIDPNCEVFTHSRGTRECELIRRPAEYFRGTDSNRGNYDSGVKRQNPPQE